MSNNPNNCTTCEWKKNPQGGWCYMFRDEPTEACKIHSARVLTPKSILKDFNRIFGTDTRRVRCTESHTSNTPKQGQ